MIRRRLIAISLVACGVPAAGCGDNHSGGSIDVFVEPERQWYHTGQPVTLVGFFSDAGGKAVNGTPIHWTVEPAGAATADAEAVDDPAAENFTLQENGRVTFTACRATSDGSPRTDGPCASVALQVDDGSPALELTAPRPGDELDGDGGIAVQGSVTDAGTLRVFVDGQLVDVDELGQFETTVPAQFGVNHLAVVASDGLTDESSVDLDVLWAPAFAPATAGDGTPDLWLDSGIALSMGQRMFDDATPFDPAVVPVGTRDLADIIELVIGSMALIDRIPDPVVNQPSLFLRISEANVGPVVTSIDVTPDGIELFLRLPSLTVRTQGELVVDESPLDLEGTVTASVAGSVRIELGRESEEAPIHVALAGLFLAVETASGDFTSAETTAIFQLAAGLLRTTLEDRLVAAVEQTIADSVPALLGSVLDGLDTGLAGLTVVLDNELFPAPITLEFDGRLRSVAPSSGIELLSVLRTRIGTTSQVAFPATRGVALHEPVATQAPSFLRDRELQVGVHLALLNGVLHALWSSGALELDLGELFLGVIEGGRLSARLPPLLRPPRAGQPGEDERFVLSLGQVEVELEVEEGQTARFGVSIDAAIDVGVQDNAIHIQAADAPRIRVWTIQAAPAGFPSEQLIESLLLDQWPTLRDSLVGGLTFDLPVLSLGDLGTIAAGLTDLTLSFALLEPVYLRGGYLTLECALRGELPPAAQ